MRKVDGEPEVILVVGVNGTGKTTSTGKLAYALRAQGKSVLLAAADTFRAAAIEQLEIWGDRTGVEVIKNKPGGDPSAVLFDALQAAKARNIDYVIVDTAGRLHTKSNLMTELEKMRRTAQRFIASAPHETLLVMDATTGQNGLQQARLFTQSAGVTGIVLTKLDGTAKGGVVVAISKELGLPVRYVGVGEKVERPVALQLQGLRGFVCLTDQWQPSPTTRVTCTRHSSWPAEASRLASPNPRVGAVLVSAEGKVVGRGSHAYDEIKHAEVLAIEAAGERAKGGTLYLNLEPCSHVGRTGPCAEAIIAAGIKRVVCAMRDPNPLVAGRGFEILHAAGIEVQEGLYEPEARKLNEAFAKYIRHKTPFVTLKTAMTLDGKIAPPPGDGITPSTMSSMASTGGWITSEVARAHVHEMRHANDAIMVGVGTIIADDPLLTDRTGLPRRRPLLRVILDSRLRLPLDSRVVRTANYDVDRLLLLRRRA